MPPKRIHRRKRANFNIQTIQLLQQLLRSCSCWNCHQVGHTRHQCPYPKSISCSFCKTPGTRTIDCKCNHQLFQIPINNNPSVDNPAVEVVVPSPQLQNIQPEDRENIIVVIENDNMPNETLERDTETESNEGTDYLELDAEDSSLDDL